MHVAQGCQLRRAVVVGTAHVGAWQQAGGYSALPIRLAAAVATLPAALYLLSAPHGPVPWNQAQQTSILGFWGAKYACRCTLCACVRVRGADRRVGSTCLAASSWHTTIGTLCTHTRVGVPLLCFVLLCGSKPVPF